MADTKKRTLGESTPVPEKPKIRTRWLDGSKFVDPEDLGKSEVFPQDRQGGPEDRNAPHVAVDFHRPARMGFVHDMLALVLSGALFNLVAHSARLRLRRVVSIMLKRVGRSRFGHCRSARGQETPVRRN